MSAFEPVILGGAKIAIESTRNDWRLRALGVRVRKTIAAVIATRCIVSGLQLLHNDRDFNAFEQHRGLTCLSCEFR